MTTIRNPWHSRRACWLAGALGLALAGCGGSTGHVSGTVRFKGAPIPGGRVTFTSRDGGGVSGFAWVGVDGSYSIRGCPTGPVKITVLSMERSRGGNGFDNPRGVVGARRSGQSRKLPAIPLRYADPRTTDLEYNVCGGNQTHDLDLKP
jgi:hypothetical protein